MKLIKIKMVIGLYPNEEIEKISEKKAIKIDG